MRSKAKIGCFKCGDGSTPLYCLNCAKEIDPKEPATELEKQLIAELADARLRREQAEDRVLVEKARADKAEAACAEKDKLLSKWRTFCKDCGTGWLSLEVVAKVREAFEKLIGFGRSDMGHQCMCDYVTETCEEALALLKERK